MRLLRALNLKRLKSQNGPESEATRSTRGAGLVRTGLRPCPLPECLPSSKGQGLGLPSHFRHKFSGAGWTRIGSRPSPPGRGDHGGAQFGGAAAAGQSHSGSPRRAALLAVLGRKVLRRTSGGSLRTGCVPCSGRWRWVRASAWTRAWRKTRGWL